MELDVLEQSWFIFSVQLLYSSHLLERRKNCLDVTVNKANVYVQLRDFEASIFYFHYIKFKS